MPNKVKQEELRKKAEARKGLSPEQIAALDEQDRFEEEIEEQARKLHHEMFPEEYDSIMDSIADTRDRNSGINPMSQDYIDTTAERRKALGVPPLRKNGMPTSDLTYKICLEIVREKLSGFKPEA